MCYTAVTQIDSFSVVLVAAESRTTYWQSQCWWDCKTDLLSTCCSQY